MDDLERLDALLSQQEASIQAAFARYLRYVQSPAILSELTNLVEAGEIDDALRILDSYVAQFGSVIPDVWRDVGRAASTELAALIPEITIAITFDVTNRRAAELVRANRVRMVTNFNESQRETVTQALTRAQMTGAGPAETARAFRDAIGLAPMQEQAVANHRARLERLDRSALDMALRDRRFDARTIRAIERERPLTQKQIDAQVGAYRRRWLITRSENIARTEALQATSAARHEAMMQMMEQAGLSRDDVWRVWHATKDKRTRDWHASMEGQERRIDQPFEDGKGNLLMFPGDPSAPAETIINCRCPVTFRVERKAA